jgi:uncharacterized protein YbjT (DUF2867 family)
MILVTGAAGLSGSAVVREFAGNGVPVRALVHYRPKAGALEPGPGGRVNLRFWHHLSGTPRT